MHAAEWPMIESVDSLFLLLEKRRLYESLCDRLRIDGKKKNKIIKTACK